MLRESWTETRAETQAEIKRRADTGVPLDGLEDPGEYDGDPDLDEVWVKICAVPARVIEETSAKYLEALDGQADAAAGDTPEERASARWAAVKANEACREVWREFVRQAVSEVRLSDEGGEFHLSPKTYGDMRYLEDADLLASLFAVSRRWHSLGKEKRATCGVVPGSTSATTPSTAAGAPSLVETSSGATVTPLHLGSPGPTTSQTLVPDVSPSATHGSGPPSGSTHTPTASSA